MDVLRVWSDIDLPQCVPVAEMNVAVDRRYTDEEQQMDYPGGLGFQFVNGIQEAQIYWGRSPSSTNNL